MLTANPLKQGILKEERKVGDFVIAQKPPATEIAASC